MSSCNAALAAYRQVLRSIPIAFKGDAAMLNGARRQARTMFDSSRSISSDEEIQACIHHAQDVAKILRQNVVQGSAEQGSQNYKLNIHSETERGDNDTIKFAGKKMRQR